MAGIVRTRVLDRVFGGGVNGIVGTAVVGWAIERLREGNAPELLDTAHLVPGETYTISTRPAPTRGERKVAKQVDAAQKRLDRIAPSPKAVRSATKQVARDARRLDKAAADSSRSAKRAASLERSTGALARLTTPSPKQLKVQAALDLHCAELARRRDESLAAARKKARPAVRREFR